MQLKKPTKNLMTEKLEAKCTQEEKNLVQQKANIYTDKGNMSEYIRYAALNFIPAKSDFEKTPLKKRGVKRKK